MDVILNDSEVAAAVLDAEGCGGQLIIRERSTEGQRVLEAVAPHMYVHGCR
jgi:hypothetical protein